MKGCLEPPIEGVVVLTYGSGNIPDSRTDLTEAVKEATDKGVVIVTCCPCRGGPHDVSSEFVEKVLTKCLMQFCKNMFSRTLFIVYIFKYLKGEGRKVTDTLH